MQLRADLSIDAPFVKGKNNQVKNCWHFYSDGNSISTLFYDEKDFIDGMNRIFVVYTRHPIVILAFCLMDTHVHFILYGNFNDCNRFMHEYLRLTSQHISKRHKQRNILSGMPLSHQTIDNDFYLKIAICYVIKNAPVGGLFYNAYDYPWGSGPLYFRNNNLWSSPAWVDDNSPHFGNLSNMGIREKRKLLKTKDSIPYNVKIINGMIFPGEYVAYNIVELIFKTPKSFNFFMGISKEEDIESKGGIVSRLSIPISEMRQHRKEVCAELFGTESIRSLSTAQRLKVARRLKSNYDSSPKQICKLCGLIFCEVKDLL